MTKLLLKTKKDHRQLRAMMAENVVTLAFTPAAGALTAGTENTPHAGITFSDSNGVGAVTYDVVSGSLPTGLTLTGNAIAGTPTEVVTAKAFSIRGTDAFGNTTTKAYTMTIAAE